DPSRLSVVEGATLAACIPNPYHRSPRSFPETSKRWRDHVLNRMRAEGYIDKDSWNRYREVAIRVEERQNITGKSAFVYEKVRQEVIDLLCYETVSKGGFQIHTTIDGSIQEIAESALKERLTMIEQHLNFKHSTLADYKAKKAEFRKSASPDQTFPAPEYLQGAALLIDNTTGSIIAQVGGRDFSDSMFDRVSQGSRPVGTAFKPFVYAAAFEKGLFPGTLVDDTPMDTRQVMVGGTTGILGEWGPENEENTYESRITARTALAKSKNAASVRLGQRVGTGPVVELAEAAGMKFEGDLKKFNATFLGRNPTSPEDLCLAYTIFPNNGRRPEKTHIISNIKDSVGNLIYSPNINLKSGSVIDRYTAYQINSILEDTFDPELGGTGSKARTKYGLGDFPVAGKTGTEYNFTDNWFVGYTSEVTCVVWAGFDQTSSIYHLAFSSDTVLPVWTKIMNAAAEEFTPRAFLPPPDALPEEICLVSGELATGDCYETVDKGDGISSQFRCTYIEYLRPGTSLEHFCSVHGRAGSNLQKLTQQTNDGKLRAGYIVERKNFPVYPIAPTVVGGDDPYGSVQGVMRARVAATVITATPIGEEEDSEPMDSNGIPLARPVMTPTENRAIPVQRVELPPPRAIEFD
ncbi:MAG: penicillin-binding transpeptidase domain-containing protein, partial [Verrucomicrobiota bacterium]